MNDIELHEHIRKLYNLIRDNVLLTQELDSAVQLLLERNPEAKKIHDEQVHEARTALTELNGVPPLEASDILARIRQATKNLGVGK